MRLSKLLTVAIALVISFQFLSIPQTADCNPVVVYDTGIGGIYANSTHVQLSEANVSIYIKYLGASTFNVSVVCSFTIYTNISQISNLAFAYPSSWVDNYPSNLNESFNILQFNIALDGQPIETWAFEWDNASWITEFDYIWNILADEPSYVGFNVDLESYTNHTLDVSTQFIRQTDRDEFSLSYIYASAETFEGFVSETITITVEEFVPLLDIVFAPNVNLTTNIENSISTATWNLYFDEAPGYYVFTRLFIDENETSISQGFDISELAIIALSVSTVIMVATLVLYKSRK